MTTNPCEEVEGNDGQYNPDPIALEKLPHWMSPFLHPPSAKSPLEEG
jgi:hypothetical protein